MKAKATLKPPARKKGRVVVCGNFAMERENGELANAASGCDAIGIRATAAKAVERGWTMGAIDVTAAFLQAPRRAQLTRARVWPLAETFWIQSDAGGLRKSLVYMANVVPEQDSHRHGDALR